MTPIYAICRNTVLETVRQPIYGLIVTVSCALIAFTPATAAHIYSFRVTAQLDRAAERLIADLGLATVLLGGLVLAVFSTTTAISREIADRTASSVLSKRVSRSEFVVGKYLGIAISMGLATLVGCITVLLTVRASASVAAWQPLDWGIILAMAGAALAACGYATWRNYFHGRAWLGSFNLLFIALMVLLFIVFALIDRENNFILSAEFNQHANPDLANQDVGGFNYDWQVARAAFLTTQAILVIASISLAASTRLGAIGNACVTGGMIILGLISEFLYHSLHKLQWRTLAEMLHLVVPNLEKFWMSDALTREQPIPIEYISITSAYALLYIAAMLLIASYLLGNRDVS